MANTITPNMSLIVPTTGSEAGPTYANDINNSLTIIDAHTHTAGSGVQITPSAININSALTMNNFALSGVSAITYTAQSSTPANKSSYVSGVDLFYVDGNGNVVQITSGGTVNATSSGISSGTATASFVAGVLVVNAAASTPANIQAGSILIGNNVASSKFLTLSPPNAMGANYTVTLPALPAQTNVMTLDTSGNMGSITYNAVGQGMTSVGANAIGASMTSTGSNAVLASSSNANIPGAQVSINGFSAVTSALASGNNEVVVLSATCNASGGILGGGGGLSISQTGSGTYAVTFLITFANAPGISVTLTSGGIGFVSLSSVTDSNCGISTFNASQNPSSIGFSIVVIGLRA
jgi:hypothetical protein